MKFQKLTKDFARRHFRFLRPLYSVLRNWRLRLLKWRPTYEDGIYALLTNAVCDFKEDARFKRSYRVAMEGGHADGLKTPFEWGNYVTCWAAEHGTKLEGDFVECGVLRGFSSRMIMEYVNFEKLDKKFYLIDTYNGFDDRFLTPEDRQREFGYTDVYPFVSKAFSGIKNAVVVRGAIPPILETLHHIKKVAYLAIDMNCAIPEIAAAEFFWPKMPAGAVMVLDDYAQQSFERQRMAFDAFALWHGVSIISLPTGQGLVIKPYDN